MRKETKDILKFSGRVHTKLGILSVIIGALALIGLVTTFVISGVLKGKGGLILGIIGIALFAASIVGFVFAYKACKQRDIFYRFPIIGLLVNGFIVVFCLILYIMGFAI